MVPFRGIFDFSMSALEANCTKPEPEIYLKSIEAAHAVPPISPEETVGGVVWWGRG